MQSKDMDDPDRKRKKTNFDYLKVSGKIIRVCSTMFLDTLGKRNYIH